MLTSALEEYRIACAWKTLGRVLEPRLCKLNQRCVCKVGDASAVALKGIVRTSGWFVDNYRVSDVGEKKPLVLVIQ